MSRIPHWVVFLTGQCWGINEDSHVCSRAFVYVLLASSVLAQLGRLSPFLAMALLCRCKDRCLQSLGSLLERLRTGVHQAGRPPCLALGCRGPSSAQLMSRYRDLIRQAYMTERLLRE